MRTLRYADCVFMPPAANPELADPIDPQGRSLPQPDGAAGRGRFLTNEILTILSVGIALAMLSVMLWGNTSTHISQVNNRIDRLEVRLDAGIDKLDDKIDKVEAKFDARFDKLDDKFDTLDAKFDSLLLALARSNVISPAEADRAAKAR